MPVRTVLPALLEGPVGAGLGVFAKITMQVWSPQVPGLGEQVFLAVAEVGEPGLLQQSQQEVRPQTAAREVAGLLAEGLLLLEEPEIRPEQTQDL
ncbi:MAG: hypothetical protein EB056_06190 [Verrucomicrobia bacterium]|nr:hypothetical protein [Verrucomicrobiota bacterium]